MYEQTLSPFLPCCRYQVYDSLYSPAHPFMLKLREHEGLRARSDTDELTTHLHRNPGEIQRWQVGSEDEVRGLRNTGTLIPRRTYAWE